MRMTKHYGPLTHCATLAYITIRTVTSSRVLLTYSDEYSSRKLLVRGSPSQHS